MAVHSSVQYPTSLNRIIVVVVCSATLIAMPHNTQVCGLYLVVGFPTQKLLHVSGLLPAAVLVPNDDGLSHKLRTSRGSRDIPAVSGTHVANKMSVYVCKVIVNNRNDRRNNGRQALARSLARWSWLVHVDTHRKTSNLCDKYCRLHEITLWQFVDNSFGRREPWSPETMAFEHVVKGGSSS